MSNNQYPKARSFRFIIGHFVIEYYLE